jgi:hypothetical protein
MKLKIIFFILLPITTWAQKDEIFAKLVNGDGSVIKGSSVTQFYERQIPVPASHPIQVSLQRKFTLKINGYV